jgi:hypothetical protein
MQSHFELRARHERRTPRPGGIGFGALIALAAASGCVDIDANVSDGGTIPTPPFRPRSTPAAAEAAADRLLPRRMPLCRQHPTQAAWRSSRHGAR